MDRDLLARTLATLGQPPYRARQVWERACAGAGSFEEMTALSKELRYDLAARVPFSTLTPVNQVEARDGTIKVLFHTHDGHPVEAVLMRYRDGRRSVCLSTQSGCALACTFCATGQMRLHRNLTAWEILDQALHFRRIEPVNHAVLMGMGEPLLNVRAVVDACAALPDLDVSARHTSVSTAGWVPGIDALRESGLSVRLALSLHAPDDELRSRLMPVNDRFPIAQVLAACTRYYEERRRKVLVEYLMLSGVNDRPDQARTLAQLLDSKIFKLNLIPYNETGAGSQTFTGSSREKIEAFRRTLETAGMEATVRVARGREIDAACGQLAARPGNSRASHTA
jgi:23S rRNA (adenine2503-C2)-methyltransferase